MERLINGAHPQERSEAAAKFRVKEAELERSEMVWKRMESLSESKAISQEELDNQRMLVTALKAEVSAAKARHDLLDAPVRTDEVHMEKARIAAACARLELAKVQLEYTKLRAPCSGTVLDVDLEPGELVARDSAQPVMILADTSRFQVRAFVEELDASRVSAGMSAKIVVDGLPLSELGGRVVRTSPRMGPKSLFSDRPSERYDTKTREVWIELDGHDGLVVGLRVDVMIDPALPTAPASSVSPPAEVGPPGSSENAAGLHDARGAEGGQEGSPGPGEVQSAAALGGLLGLVAR